MRFRPGRSNLTMAKTTSRGRPPYVPDARDRGLVEVLVASGLAQDQIATALEISVRTLRKYYKRELTVGTIKANAAVAQALFNQAKNGNVKAQMFWLSCRAGWKPAKITEHQGEGGGPIRVQVTARELFGLTDEQVERQLAEAERESGRASR